MNLWPEPEFHIILADGSISGPHSLCDVDAMLEDGEIGKDFYGFTEGMPEWRAVEEALVWAHRPLAALVRAEIDAQSDLLFQGEIKEATARVAINGALNRAGIRPTGRETFCLEIITEIATALRQSHRDYVSGVGSGAIEAFPASELFEAQEPDFPRDWNAAWQKVGGRIYDSRLIALKTDSVWARLSDFGYPFPPFSFDRSRWIRDVSFSETREIAIVLRDELLPSAPPLVSVF